ncbi:MAG: GPP34 family phosphoprotein [Bacillota bacterium]|nr:GPP34 family phosphoprotein [Bacillota bacterium]
MLNMAEQIILMSIQNENGKTYMRATYLKRYGLSAALLYELIDRKKLELRGKKLFVKEESSTQDEILDLALQAAKKTKSINRWIYGNQLLKGRLRRAILKSLADRGIVKEEETRFLGLIPMKRYPISNVFEKRSIEIDIRNVLINGYDNEYRSVFMTSILVVCRGATLILSKEERKKIASKLKFIGKGKYFNNTDELLANTIKAIRIAIAAESSS